MAQELHVRMGLSVKAMIFHDGKLLILQKNDDEIRHHTGNFLAAAFAWMKTFLRVLDGRYWKKRA